MSTEILPVFEIEMRRKIAHQARHRVSGDVRVEVGERVLELEVGGHQVVAGASHLALPSRVALDAGWPQHPQPVGQVAESFLKEQVAAGARMRLRADPPAADGKLDTRTEREDEFVAAKIDQFVLVGEVEIAESGEGFALLFEALVTGK